MHTIMIIVGILLLSGCITASYPYQKTGSTQLTGLDELWQSFQIRFKKNYQLEEEPLRRKIWEENVQFIQRHNLEYDLGIHTYTVGLNEYADLSPQEYQKYLLGFRPVPSKVDFHSGSNMFKYDKHQAKDLPDNWDWRKYGYVTPIKNQGQCGSCWAFSSTGSLEGQNFRKTGRLVSLSEQNLVDCCIGTYGNAGCNGGWMMNAFSYIKDNQGIDRENSYPYEAKDDTCRYNSQDKGADDTGYTMIPKDDEMALKAAAAKVGPISVAIDASKPSFQLYRSGVYVEPTCSHNETDHAVLVVGYGVWNPGQTPKTQFEKTWDKLPENVSAAGQDYWLVKNSWGTSWGTDGYIMMARNLANQCAIASYACYPTE